ncbi:hypothetical protein ColKHC_10551 [Colletotrichum higginsianum]|nr:hypothetical protein ColKHC_10551 [Colletotrichum higginsianum]
MVVAAVVSLLDVQLPREPFQSTLLSAMVFMTVKSPGQYYTHAEYGPKVSSVVKVSLLMVFKQAQMSYTDKLRAYVNPSSQPQVIDDVVDLMQRVAYSKGPRRRLTPLAWLFTCQQNLANLRRTGDTANPDWISWSIHPDTGEQALSFRQLTLIQRSDLEKWAASAIDAAEQDLMPLLFLTDVHALDDRVRRVTTKPDSLKKSMIKSGVLGPTMISGTFPSPTICT